MSPGKATQTGSMNTVRHRARDSEGALLFVAGRRDAICRSELRPRAARPEYGGLLPSKPSRVSAKNRFAR